MRFLLLCITICLTCATLSAQQAFIYGTVADSAGTPVPGVSIYINQEKTGDTTDAHGYYRVKTFAGKEVLIGFTCIRYKASWFNLTLKNNEQHLLNIKLISSNQSLDAVVVKDAITREPGMVRINPLDFIHQSTPSLDISSILSKFGAQSNNELSNQYNVHGGNFDENLVYLNDFEIYRPQLISSAQQEGLSVINPDLVSNILFSTGGFQPKYGDKLSSVLDVTYRKPVQFAGSISASLLGGNAHLEGRSKNTRFTYIIGARYKTTQYLLNSLDTKGDYKPKFGDVQAYATYTISDKLELGMFAYASTDYYQLIPQSRTTSFGTVSTVLQLQMYFNGQEIDRFTNYMGGLNLTYHPNKNVTLKWYTQSALDNESQTYDITAQYYIGQVQTDQSKSNYGQIQYYLGVGTSQNYGRDYLNTLISGIGHKGEWRLKQHTIQWGVHYQNEDVNYDLKQWSYLDSAGYSLPYNDAVINTNDYIKTSNHLNTNRYDGYLQDTWVPNIDKGELTITYGGRLSYWSYNQQLTASPRTQASFIPHNRKDWIFKAAVGLYQQPPFYREILDANGLLHSNVLAQQSLSYVLSADHTFKVWDRPFKFVTEVYYKQLFRINPYDVNDVRITYYANNNGHGYAEGADFRLNGELVKDVESWISLGLLHTEEKIDGLTYTQNGETYATGWVRRPSDQLVNFNMYFQDYLPRRKDFKVHLNFAYGSGLPASAPFSVADRSVFKYPPYRRVDIGFSALLMDGKKHKDKMTWKYINSIWASLEVFNLLGVQNTVSYTWVKDYYNHQFAVPNYLTGRLLNLRIIAKF